MPMLEITCHSSYSTYSQLVSNLDSLVDFYLKGRALSLSQRLVGIASSVYQSIEASKTQKMRQIS